MIKLVGARIVNVVAMSIGFVVLSRLVSVADFGLYAFALTGYGAAKVLTDFGLRDYLIRRQGRVRTETIAMAALLSGVMAVAGATALLVVPTLLPAQFLPDRLAQAMIPFAIALFIQPILLQREVHLHRDIAFTVPALADVTAVLVEVVTGIALAIQGYGLLALAWAALAGQVARALALFALSRGKRPARLRFRGLPYLTAFGIRQTGVQLLPKLADMVLISALTGAGGAIATGLYNRASRVPKLVDETLMTGIDAMVLPAMTDVLRRGATPAAMVAGKTSRLLPVLIPAFLGVVLLAEPLVLVLLGPGWEAAIPAVRILALAGLAGPVNLMALKAFTAINRVSDFARIQSITLAVQVVLAAGGAFLSLYAFCAGIAVAKWLKAGLILYWEHRHLGLRNAYAEMRFGAAAVASLAALAGPTILVLFAGLPPLLLLLASGLLALIGWLTVLRLTNHPLWTEFGLSLRGLRWGD